MLAETPARYLDIPAFSPTLKLDPPISGGQPTRQVETARAMREELSAIGVDIGVIFPDNLLLFAPVPNVEVAVAIAHAYDRWLAAEWLGKAGLDGALLVSPQDPDDTAKEIARYAGNDKVVAVYLPMAGVNPLWGHRKYDPIFAAAQDADRPVLLHSVTLVSPVFPCRPDQSENQPFMMGHDAGSGCIAIPISPPSARRSGARTPTGAAPMPRRPSFRRRIRGGLLAVTWEGHVSGAGRTGGTPTSGIWRAARSSRPLSAPAQSCRSRSRPGPASGSTTSPGSRPKPGFMPTSVPRTY